MSTTGDNNGKESNGLDYDEDRDHQKESKTRK
jgi:hypothetical protein